jgi:type I restriction enzyme S subunit
MNRIPLSQLLHRLESGSRPRGGVSNDTGTIPSLGGEHLTGDGRFDFSNLKTISEIFFRDLRSGVIRRGDILIVKDGATTGKTAFVSEDFPFEQAAINEHVFRLEVDRHRASPGFVFRYLRSPEGQEQIVKQIRGAAIGGINRSFVDYISLPDMSIDDQHRIGAVLDKADALCRQRHESIKHTEKLLQSVFIDMFGDLKANPKGWEQVSLENLCERIVDCPHSTPIYSDSQTGFYCVRSSDIQNGKLDLTSARHVSEIVFTERIARHEPKAGEVIYTREGGRLGYAAQVTKGKKICLGQRMMLFSARENVASNAFLNGLLNSESFRNKVQSLVGGGAAPRVNIKDIRVIEVYKPPIDLQLRYEQFASVLSQEEELLANSEAHLTRLFSSIQQRAFRGDLDLSRLLLLDSLDDAPPRLLPEKAATNDGKSKGATIFLQPPEAIVLALKELDDTVSQGAPIPWSADYFKYRILGTQPTPFSFSEVMQKAESIFDEPPYEEIKDIILQLLGKGGGRAYLSQRFDIHANAQAKDASGRKEIVFEPTT